MAKNTYENYERHIVYHIAPWFDSTPLEELGRRDVADWIFEVETLEVDPGELYSTSTIQDWWRTLRMILGDATAEGFLPRDVVTGLKPPNNGVDGKREQRTLSAEQLGDLLEAVRETGKYAHRYPEVATMAYTGMRTCGLYGLGWQHVDWDDMSIEVRRSCWRGTIKPRTKTGKPRQVPMPQIVADALQKHRKRMLREQHPGLGSEHNLVFPADNGKPRYGTSLREVTVDAAKIAGLDVHVTPHVLRRTFNTVLLEARVAKAVIQSMIGHQTDDMTELYAGVSLEQKRDAIREIAPDDREVSM